ncbi:hypothetical protein [Paenibacillus sp. FSL H8-0332]|uniref:hypothetical protein n=1 Tax=Paenibacillus sp. FSL H8-0332 TaxID=2954742 RepID=UPI0030CCF1B0
MKDDKEKRSHATGSSIKFDVTEDNEEQEKKLIFIKRPYLKKEKDTTVENDKEPNE